MTTNALYLQEPGNGTDVSMFDINQGPLNDCFVLSAMGTYARECVIQGNTGLLKKMIHDNGNGTQTVTLYKPHIGLGAWDPFTITINDQFSTIGVNSAPGTATYNGFKEIWPQVLEKAYAESMGGNGSINHGGFPAAAMGVYTGAATWAFDPHSGVTYAQLASYANNHDLMTFDTPATGALGYGLVNDHSYVFAGFSGTGATAKVLLHNPWNFSDPTPIPIGQIAAAGINEIDLGHIQGGLGHWVPKGAGFPDWTGT